MFTWTGSWHGNLTLFHAAPWYQPDKPFIFMTCNLLRPFIIFFQWLRYKNDAHSFLCPLSNSVVNSMTNARVTHVIFNMEFDWYHNYENVILSLKTCENRVKMFTLLSSCKRRKFMNTRIKQRQMHWNPRSVNKSKNNSDENIPECGTFWLRLIFGICINFFHFNYLKGYANNT